MCYQSAKDDEQRGVFDQLQTVANLFNSDASFQYLLTNIPLPEEEIGRRRFFDETAAGSNAGLARLFNEVLNERVREGSNNLRSSRYISYSVEAPTPPRRPPDSPGSGRACSRASSAWARRPAGSTA
mgnify:CR=1 FL=1